jgi:hypothetical protein
MTHPELTERAVLRALVGEEGLADALGERLGAGAPGTRQVEPPGGPGRRCGAGRVPGSEPAAGSRSGRGLVTEPVPLEDLGGTSSNGASYWSYWGCWEIR